MNNPLALSDYMNAPAAPPADGIVAPPLFTATVQGMDAHGEWFERNVPLDGHLDGDLYLRLDRVVELDAALFIVMRLAGELDRCVPAVRLAVHGLVDRAYPLPDDCWDVRIRVLDSQLL
jgi:hypothetical protein